MRSAIRFGIAALLLSVIASSTQAGDAMDRYYAQKASRDASYWAQVQANQASSARFQQQMQYQRMRWDYAAPRTYYVTPAPARGWWVYGY